MKHQLVFIILFISLLSCDNKYDVESKQADGTIHKFKCKDGKDTSNSTCYRYYDWVLVSKKDYVNGKVEGSVIDYFPDGTIKIITNYINDTVHGINKVYSDSGTLLRRSFYIKNKQVLFETGIVNGDFPGIFRKKITYKNINNELIWAGELYLDQNNEPKSVGFIMTKPDSLVYKGMYVNILIDDTINLDNNCTVGLDITLPKIVYQPELLFGEFDKELKCIDTIYYAKPDSVEDSFTFKFRPNKQGNNYLIGRLSNIDKLIKDDIYFFKGFYVKPN